MSLQVASRQLHPGTLEKKFPRATIVDVTSKGPAPWVRCSPFYPHGGIPVPFSPGEEAASVEGIWQGLKVFSSQDVDPSKLQVTSMRGLKRTVARLGQVLGHRAGLAGERLLSYREARREIYLPSYHWVLTHKLHAEVAALRRLVEAGPVVLLDYETNCDLDDLRRPLSHASLVQRFIEDRWPA